MSPKKVKQLPPIKANNDFDQDMQGDPYKETSFVEQLESARDRSQDRFLK